LYLYIYIALLEVHPNQKSFQCNRTREEWQVLRNENRHLPLQLIKRSVSKKGVDSKVQSRSLSGIMHVSEHSSEVLARWTKISFRSSNVFADEERRQGKACG